VLDLSGNPLSQLAANEFRQLGLTHLQRVILQRCALRHIDGTAFYGLTNLVELDLSHNVLSSIPTQAFQFFPELRELKLNGNPLLRLAGQTFALATKLVRLEIANCQLNHIDQKAFHVRFFFIQPKDFIAFRHTLSGNRCSHNPPIRTIRRV
jgi:netrin-G1 ligand